MDVTVRPDVANMVKEGPLYKLILIEETDQCGIGVAVFAYLTPYQVERLIAQFKEVA